MKFFGLLLFPIVMFTAAKAFSSYAARRSSAFRPRCIMVRGMSTTSAGGGEADTTIVDVCRTKIQEALGATDVKVTGTMFRHE